MVVTDSRRLADRARLLANHGITRPTWARRQSGDYYYDVAALGLKANMSDLLAALGLSQWRRFEQLMSRRRRVMDWYRAALRDCDLIAWPSVPAHAASSCHLCQVFLRTEELRVGRDAIFQDLQAAGVPCGVHFIPLYRFSYYRKAWGLQDRDFPATERAWRSVLTLPHYPDLPRRDVVRIAQILTATLTQYRR
jgi:perosamine synthetase